jgi:peptidoglycan/LPS O-acetylase OafA/YrhL
LFFVMFICLIRSNGIGSKILSSRFCVTIGRASYSLYLTHIIAIYIVIKRVPPEHHGILPAAIALLAVTSVYYLLVEKPFVILSKRIRVK